MTKINFTGNLEDIKEKIESTVATYELLGSDSTINFEQWYEGWEKGFPDAIENRSLGNYALTGEKAWRAKPENWPRWRQWSNQGGIIKGEYWRDRANDEDSLPLSGTAIQLINQIVQLEHQKDVQVLEQGIASDVIRHSGIPEITLYFRGANKLVSGKSIKPQGKKSFRFMGYTDNPTMAEKRQDLELITQTDIDRMGTKILSVFGTTPPYTWQKGKKLVVYHDWMRGYNLNVYTSTHAEGDRLIAAILNLRDLQVDESLVKYGEAKNPVQAYPPATDYQVLGEIHTRPERFPNVEVVFQYAKIYLPTIKKDKIIA